MQVTDAEGRVPSFLRDINLKLIIFGGKGGTGKTTSAAATAMCLSQLTPWKKILVVSTDPAHSLADSFNCAIGARPTPVWGNLSASELDPPTLLNDFKEKHSKALKKLLHRASILDQANIKDFVTFSLPGMDEMMAILQIAQNLKPNFDSRWGGEIQPAFDLIILDTAPTGHTLRLLGLPERMTSWVRTMDTSLDRYRRGTFRAVPFNFPWIETYTAGDSVDQFVDMLKSDLEMVKALLRNPREAEFIPVTIPESLGISETEDLLAVLNRMEIPVRNILVNRVREEQQCDFCSPKTKEQEKYMAEIGEKFGSYNLLKMPLLPHEVRGREGLIEFAEHLIGKSPQSRATYPVASSPQVSPIATKIPDLLQKDLTFILFGGKGGVGKTSIAAATALRIARNNPEKRVLIYSTDPAHSLADSFDCPIGDEVTAIGDLANLYSLEVDAAKIHADFKKEYGETVDKAFDYWQSRAHTWGIQQELKYDRRVMSAYVDSSPPGLDEVFMLERILDSVEKAEYDLYILDTAPTGHLLYLLEFPELVREWVRVTFRALLKHQREKPVPELQTIADKIAKSNTAVRKIREAFTNPRQTGLVSVTIGEAMGVLEMQDLLSAVGRLGIPCHHIIINMVFPSSECGFCMSKREEQLRYIERVNNEYTPLGYRVTELPLFPQEIKGLDDLTKLGEILYEGVDKGEIEDVVAPVVRAALSPQPEELKERRDREKVRHTLTRWREKAEEEVAGEAAGEAAEEVGEEVGGSL